MNIPPLPETAIFDPGAPPPSPPVEQELPPPPSFKPLPQAGGVAHINPRTFETDTPPEEGQPHLEDLFPANATLEAGAEAPRSVAQGVPVPNVPEKPPMTPVQIGVDFLMRWLSAVEEQADAAARNADAQERIAGALEDVSSRMRDEMERKMSHFGAKD